MAEIIKPQLVIFDFDWSFVDQDTDRYVFEVLSPELRILLRARQNEMQWTDNVADCLKRLHEKGFKRQQIEEAFHTLPFHPAMKRAVTELKTKTPTTFFLLSNSNSIFISTILHHHQLMIDDSKVGDTKKCTSLFSEIVTNPAEWKDDLIDLKRKVDPNGIQHQCKVGCSANMCKGEELEAFLERHGGRESFSKISYVGDGGNDFCPILRLSKNDIAFVRKYKELEKRIAKEGKTAGLEAKVEYWGEAWELEQSFRKLLYSGSNDVVRKAKS